LKIEQGQGAKAVLGREVMAVTAEWVEPTIFLACAASLSEIGLARQRGMNDVYFKVGKFETVTNL
jgi:hypothetical protein